MSSTVGKHHEAGRAVTTQDQELIDNALSAVRNEIIISYREEAPRLVHIATVELAYPEVSQCLTRFKALGLKSLKSCLETGRSTMSVPKLHM